MRSSTALLLVASLVACGHSTPSPAKGAEPTSPATGGGKGRLPRAFKSYGEIVLGPKLAPVKIDQYSDFQCPFCSVAFKVVYELAKNRPKQVRLRYFDYPLDISCNPQLTRPFHPDACSASRFARCAAQEGRFWRYASLLYRNQRALGGANLAAYAAQIGLDGKRVAACAAGKRARDAVKADIERAVRLGVRGTPTFFVNGERVDGYRSRAWWERKVKEKLAAR